MHTSRFLEVISSNPADSSTIEAHGGNRIELVSALEIGGLTPSSTIVRKSLEAASIPTHVIVRHHNNGFIHTDQEISLLIGDVIELRDRFNVHGVVIGGLEKHGLDLLVDTNLMQQVMRQCGGKTKVTFHKASDQTKSLQQTAEMLSKMQVYQILTQGGTEPALSAANITAIRSIEEQRRKSMILAGGGITHSNVKQIIQEWGVERVHIGTCVRTPKYGAVSGQLVEEFRQILDS